MIEKEHQSKSMFHTSNQPIFLKATLASHQMKKLKLHSCLPTLILHVSDPSIRSLEFWGTLNPQWYPSDQWYGSQNHGPSIYGISPYHQ